MQIRRGRRECSADLMRVGLDEMRLTARARQAVVAVRLGSVDAELVIALLQETTRRLRRAIALADHALHVPGRDPHSKTQRSPSRDLLVPPPMPPALVGLPLPRKESEF